MHIGIIKISDEIKITEVWNNTRQDEYNIQNLRHKIWLIAGNIFRAILSPKSFQNENLFTIMYCWYKD